VPGPDPVEQMGAKVDYQVAAPAETRTPNLHRAKIAHKRVRMEGWRQRRLGSNSRNPQKEKTDLTLAGLLMEGICIPSRLRRYTKGVLRIDQKPPFLALRSCGSYWRQTLRTKTCLELCTLMAGGCTLSVGREVKMETQVISRPLSRQGESRHAHFKALLRSSDFS
jgi:hypothetical protein